MDENRTDTMTNGMINDPGETPGKTGSPEMLRREFMKRFGVYAAGSAVGLYVLMSPGTSAVAGSDGGLERPQSLQEPDKQTFQYKEYQPLSKQK